MSFKCDKCKESQLPGTKPFRVVTKRRKRIYPLRLAEDGKTVIDKGGHGWEIAHEMNLCNDCYTEGKYATR